MRAARKREARPTSRRAPLRFLVLPPLFGLLVGAFGCSYTVPTPKTGPHENEEPVEVPFPPPPARVELIPDAPAAKKKIAVWVDGAWEWKVHRWVWLAGQWEVPQANSYYAPPITIRLSDGSLKYFPGAWKIATSNADVSTARK